MGVLRAIGWLVLLVVGSVAAAGLVLTLDHRPTSGARPELTAVDAAILAPRMAALEPDLDSLATGAQALSAAGREVLVRLRALDPAGASGALAEGDLALTGLAAARAALGAAAPALLDGLGDGRHLPTADRDRVVAVGDAMAAADTLPGAWASIGAAAAAPARILIVLADHDAAVLRATDAGRAERYADALAALDAADAALLAARPIRDATLGAGRDVTMLDGWTVRLADHDLALRRLYTELAASGGARTPAVESAIALADAARAALPATQDALIIAVADLGAGDITTWLLAIEDARGAIDAALDPSGVAPPA